MSTFKSATIASGGNAKTVKGDKAGTYETAIMYLAPADASGMGNVCPMAVVASCKAACLYSAGRAGFQPNIKPARVAKTQRYFTNRAAFMGELVRDIAAFVRYCERRGVRPAVRLNGTSDIQWEVNHPCERNGEAFASIFAAFPEVQFYDYTKIAKRVYRALPANYALTLSYSEASPEYAATIRKAAADTGCNVAVVYRSKAHRDGLLGQDGIAGLPVFDGDETDMRFTDPRGVTVGLYAKGPAKRDTTGFVVG